MVQEQFIELDAPELGPVPTSMTEAELCWGHVLKFRYLGRLGQNPEPDIFAAKKACKHTFSSR